MKFPARLIMLLSTLFFFTNISFAHADDITDQVTAYRNAKSVFDNAMNVYNSSKTPRMSAYKDADIRGVLLEL